MKRSGTLKRTTRLDRTGYLRRTGRLNPKSVKMRRAEARRARVRAEVFARDGHRCQFPHDGMELPCVGDLTPHHLLKASQGGKYEPDNLVSICAAANTWIEDHPIRARALGMVRFAWESSLPSTEEGRAAAHPPAQRSAAS